MSSSARDMPRCRHPQSGAAAISLVLGLLVLVSLIGGSALNLFSVEMRQTTSSASGLRLEQLARMGLEANYSLLRTLGAPTRLVGSEQQVQASASTTNRDVTHCNFFPRTDDVKLPVANGGDHADPELLASGAASCQTARASHPDLFPPQLARHLGTSNPDVYDTGVQLDALSQASDRAYRSVFPWVRYRSEAVMNAQYGESEKIQAQINQCGLASQFKSQAANSAMPLHRYRYQQDLDGLGEGWIHLGSSTHNIYQDGLSLEAWVWMGNEASAARTWQHIFDVGRSMNDGNVVLAYNSSSKKIDFHIKGRGSCSDPASNTAQRACSSELFAVNPAGLVEVPWNNAAGNSLSESGGNDLWYYIGVTADPASVPNPKVRIYTQCSRTSGAAIADPKCQAGGLVRGSGTSGLYQRLEQDLPWSAPQNYAHLRHAWVGKSQWAYEDFRGKIRDARVWGRALSLEELAQPITATVTDNLTQSSLIAVQEQRQSLRISPVQRFGNDRLLLFTVRESGMGTEGNWRLVSCAWNHETQRRVTRSVRFRVLGEARPEATEFLPY